MEYKLNFNWELTPTQPDQPVHMTEAKNYKLKEYFTTITQHDHIEPTDSGVNHIYERPSSVRSSKSPVRFNDTFRSSIFNPAKPWESQKRI